MFQLSFPFSSEQTADFRNCLIDPIKPFAALFEHRRALGGEEDGGVRSSENHATNNRRGTKFGAVLNYRNATNVRFWPLADIASCAAHVRFQG